MNWIKKPNQYGYYYYATNQKDWDLYKIIRVRSIEDSEGIVFEAKHPISGWTDVEYSIFQDYIWYGPLPKPEKPNFLD